jgi:hypothetical protein
MTMPRPFATEHPLTTGKDISSVAFWHQTFGERDKTFAWLRRNAPVSWHEPMSCSARRSAAFRCGRFTPISCSRRLS